MNQHESRVKVKQCCVGCVFFLQIPGLESENKKKRNSFAVGDSGFFHFLWRETKNGESRESAERAGLSVDRNFVRCCRTGSSHHPLEGDFGRVFTNGSSFSFRLMMALYS